jgi:hypothetical protein
MLFCCIMSNSLPAAQLELIKSLGPMNNFSQYVMEAARRRGVHIRLARAARRYGLDVRESSKHPNLVDFINDRKIDVVLDVGANAGQFGQKLRGFGYRGDIVSYEPVSSAFKYLEGIAKSDDKWTVHDFAIGAESGQLKINISANSKFSSTLSLSSPLTKSSSADSVLSSRHGGNQRWRWGDRTRFRAI